jgi:hydroxymethylbilane synthase
LDVVSECLDPTGFIPQVGQGALALEARSDDPTTRATLALINDAVALLCVTAERAFLEELGAGCSIPAGAFATVKGETLTLRGVMLEPDGTQSVRAELQGGDPHEIGSRLARHLRDDLGGGAFVAGI